MKRHHHLVAAAVLAATACSGARTGGGDDDSVDALAADAPTSSAPPVINELMLNPPADPVSGDEIHEFLEIKGAPSTDYSAYAILQVRGNGTPEEVGQVRSVHPLGTTDGAGLWSTGYLTDVLKNNTYTFLLVEGYDDGGVEDPDVDGDDDGVIDAPRWTRIVDAVAIQDDGAAGAADRKYTTVVLLPGADGVADEFGGASRIPDGTDTDTAADFWRNDPEGGGLPGLDVDTASAGEALSTMGLPNHLGEGTGGGTATATEALDTRGAANSRGGS